MFGIGVPELMLILALALIFIGPKKLPDLAKSLGKALNEFRYAASDLKESVNLDQELSKVKSSFKAITQTGTAAGDMPVQPSAASEYQTKNQEDIVRETKKHEGEHVERG